MFGKLVRSWATVVLVLLVTWMALGGFMPNPYDLVCGAFKAYSSGLLLVEMCLAAGLFTGFLYLPAVNPAHPAFEPNLGQAAAQHQFLLQDATLRASFSSAGVIVDLDRGLGAARITLVGGNPRAETEALDPLPGRTNYFFGQDPERWITDVPTFARLRFREVYPNIDVEYHSRQGSLEQDFVVRPGADPYRIEMEFAGAGRMGLDPDGGLTIETSGRKLNWKKPHAYQDLGTTRRVVESRYRMLAANRVGFEVGAWDPKRPLVIDPVIVYSTYLGGAAAETGVRVALDANGNAYLVGMTTDAAFPVTSGAYSFAPPDGGRGNVMLAKFGADGQLVYRTYFGGSAGETGFGLALDSAANVYVVGATYSTDFPVTAGVLRNRLTAPGQQGVSMDCFVTKLNTAGNALVYSTYLGGMLEDACAAVAVNASGQAFVTGWTVSPDFPLSATAAQRTQSGLGEAFITKLNSAGSAVVYSTLLGGTGLEGATAIALDSTGSAYVTGHTNSTAGFPVTAGAYQRAYAGPLPRTNNQFGDAFVAKLNPDGSAFTYCTYLGGTADEVGGGIAVDSTGSAYVVGNTRSANFPVSAQAFQRTFRGAGGNAIYPGGDGFLAKLDPAGGALVYATFLGGAKDDWATAVAVDSSGRAAVTGATLSADFPTTADARQRVFGGGSSATMPFATGDAFLTQFNNTGTALVYSTYLGGPGDEYALGAASSGDGGVLVVGGGALAAGFPTTTGAWQTSFGGTSMNALPIGDAFLAKLGPEAPRVSVAGISSAASYAGGAVAPGEIVVLMGDLLGPTQLVVAAPSEGSFGTSLAGVRVLFDDVPGAMLYASQRQTSVIVPYAVAGRATTTVVVESGGQRSAPVVVPVVAAKPALFSANASGVGQGAILNQDYGYNSAANPADKGAWVMLYGTGEGQTNPPGVDGRLALTLPLPAPLLPVKVSIGGTDATVAYAGAAPQAVAGLFQINAQIPPGAASGNLEVIVTVGETRSQRGVTVAVR